MCSVIIEALTDFSVKTDNIWNFSDILIRFKIVVTSDCPVFAAFASVGLKFSAAGYRIINISRPL